MKEKMIILVSLGNMVLPPLLYCTHCQETELAVMHRLTIRVWQGLEQLSVK